MGTLEGPPVDTRLCDPYLLLVSIGSEGKGFRVLGFGV